jgi:hypothetical protein
MLRRFLPQFARLLKVEAWQSLEKSVRITTTQTVQKIRNPRRADKKHIIDQPVIKI